MIPQRDWRVPRPTPTDATGGACGAHCSYRSVAYAGLRNSINDIISNDTNKCDSSTDSCSGDGGNSGGSTCANSYSDNSYIEASVQAFL